MLPTDKDDKKHKERVQQITEKKYTQFEKFVSAANELGCDESEAAFNDKLKKMVKSEKPKDKK